MVRPFTQIRTNIRSIFHVVKHVGISPFPNISIYTVYGVCEKTLKETARGNWNWTKSDGMSSLALYRGAVYRGLTVNIKY